MRLGVIARAEDRGLGIQTWEVVRHLNPDRVLVVNPGRLARGFVPHLDRYPGATVADWDGHQFADPAAAKAWLDGLDVVYTAETLYDWRMVEWADRAGVATVVHVNPEFYKHDDPNLPHPTAWWAPTSWRLDHLPRGATVVPMPCPTDRWPDLPSPSPDGRLRVLHVAGHQANRDRNGTLLVLDAARLVSRETVDLRVVTQDRVLRHRGNNRRHRIVPLVPGPADYWRLYDDADVLLLPRRYGGLCLPAIEAMGAGLVVAMTDVAPQTSTWPIVGFPAARSPRPIRAPGGAIDVYDAHPRVIAETVARLASDPTEVAAARAAAVRWADQHSWDALEPVWRAALADAAGTSPQAVIRPSKGE